jgi:hypothetical protein
MFVNGSLQRVVVLGLFTVLSAAGCGAMFGSKQRTVPSPRRLPVPKPSSMAHPSG